MAKHPELSLGLICSVCAAQLNLLSICMLRNLAVPGF